MRKAIVITGIFFICCTLLNAQDPVASGEDVLMRLMDAGDERGGCVRTDSLIVAHYHRLISKNMQEKGVPGYRIRIYSGSGVGAKEEQRRIRAKFLSLYPGIDAYNEYDEPFFKVYVGDCRTRSEALQLNDEVRKNFPNSIIREDLINLKNTD